MKKRTTYRLLIQSEEKSRNILETALYAIFALSALTAIWQFADQPAIPTYHTGAVIQREAAAGFPS